MDFIDKICELSARISKQLENIQTEEATKHALVMPFIAALGYNVFDPTEVTPELCADVGLKKSEKVDYAILSNGKPIILFEVKHHAVDLGKSQMSQLYRYFGVTEARFGVLTNGLLYWFFTDLEAPNKMDSKPFFEFNMLDIKETAVEELKKFSKSSFDLDYILTTASELKYTREIKRMLLEQMQEPTDDFVKFFASHVYGGRVTQEVRELFSQLTKQAFKQVINDQINERLKSALASDVGTTSPAATDSSLSAGESKNIDDIETTEEELEGYHIVRAIVRECIPSKRVAMRDVHSYCGILLDNNNRKPICRLHFNTAQKYLSFFDTEKEEKIPIESLDDIYKYADRLRSTVIKYDSKKGKSKEASE
ncbi:MAG TPA: type I restriction endonuclease [Syntrophales bacterium]|nr:type I restriction endonuclease [Syntrophales bacterium]HQN77998.1 type I restriction endonuclease [Syntrophales bacterium]HQQ26830.1 type I restriction endonuclease [Syntrophales bacterium]